MSKITNFAKDANLLREYEQNLRSQLQLINQIRLSQSRLDAIPTSEFYNLMGSQIEMHREVEAEQQISNALNTCLCQLIQANANLIAIDQNVNNALKREVAK